MPAHSHNCPAPNRPHLNELVCILSTLHLHSDAQYMHRYGKGDVFL